MKRVVLFVLLTLGYLLVALPTWAQPPHWQWAHDQPFTVRSVATDAQGNAYVTGQFSGSITVGKTRLTSISAICDLVVAKYDPQGRPQWATSLGALPDNPNLANLTYASGSDISVNPLTGDAVVVGGMEGLFPSSVPGTNLPPELRVSDKMLVVRISAAGRVLWTVQAGSGSGLPTRAVAVALDAQNNCYITGSTYGFTLSSGGYVSTGSRQMYVLSLNSAGNFRWNMSPFSPLSARGLDLGVDAQNGVYVLGVYFGPLTIGGATLPAQSPSPGTLMTRLDGSSGAVVWARGDQEGPTSLAVEPQGGGYVAGSFSGTYSLGGTSITATAAREATLAKFTAGGAVTWLKSVGESVGSVGVAYSDTGPIVLLKRSATVAAVVGLSTAGAVGWQEQATGIDVVNNPAVTAGAGPRQRRVLVGGQLAGQASFPPHALQANASNYVASLVFTGATAPPTSSPITVFPNPAQGRFSVILPPQAGISAALINSQGRVVRTEADFLPGKLDDKQLDVVNLPRGLYVLRVSKNGEVNTIQVQLQ